VAISAPSATKSLEKAEYFLEIGCSEEIDIDNPHSSPDGLSGGWSSPRTELAFPNSQSWKTWVQTILEKKEILIDHTTKSGKVKVVNLRDRLFELELIQPTQRWDGFDGRNSKTTHPIDRKTSSPDNTQSQVVLRYIGSCRNDGTLLKPEHMTQMLKQVSGHEFQLRSAHRSQLYLGKDG